MGSGQLRRTTSLNSMNERTYACERLNKRWLWVALCRRTRQVVANAQGRPLGQDLRLALEPDSTKPRLKDYRQGQSLSDFWKSSEATASEPTASLSFCGRPQPPAGRKVQWRASPCREIFRATAAKADPLRPANPSGLPVRVNESLDDEAVRGVVQRSRHLTSTRYQREEWSTRRSSDILNDTFNLIFRYRQQTGKRLLFLRWQRLISPLRKFFV